jgi:3-deoxy-D-manno-octulosonate 8-phosphate phosphatase (KDO 8-P phosphatase)
LKHIRLLALDSDGVLTDGGVYLADDGHEFRRFDIKDGLGLKRVMQAGLQVAIISSASCEVVRIRAEALGIKHVYLGVQDKLACLKQVCSQLGINLDQVAYMGDDLPDLPVIQAVGFPIAPADAMDKVKSLATMVTLKAGGRGAVREVCDGLVKIL